MEHAPLDQDFLQVPEPVPDAAPEIPDDWDEELAPSEAPAQHAESGDTSSWPGSDDPFGPAAAPGPDLAESQAPPLPEQPTAAPSQAPRAPQPAAQPPAMAAKKAIEAFYAGAGLSEVEIPEAEIARTLELLGTLFREVVQGLMEVLAARSSIKSEFRLSQTIIQPVENNPLKFSLGVDDALIALLTKHGKGYLPPVDAIQEALDDIKAHQVAVLAGMQVALTSLLARFDPNALEARIGQEKGIGTLLTAKKSRYWDEFTRLYQNIAVEAEDDFQRVFGREFGRAYEEQVRKQGKRRT
jgi:type VI secretion system protein